MQKKEAGVLEKCDIEMLGSNARKLIGWSILGGWVSGALGIGGGNIFNPLLVSMGVPPAVATATSMYMITFSSGGATLTFIIYRLINLEYSVWIGLIGSIGATGGLALFNKYT